MRLAQHMAVASDRVTATAIEATEFPDLSRAYRVMAVPKIVINDRVEFEVPTQTAGDNYARYLVRMAEIEQSMRIAEQALAASTICPSERSTSW